MRRLAWGSVVLSATLAAIGTGWLALGSLPKDKGSYSLPGLGASANASFDAWDIPKISGKNRQDAYRILGFITAQNRLFQMDLLRRHASGRLAEVLGPGLADSDRWHRTLGFEQVARAVQARLPASQNEVLNAYAAGVNEAMDELRVVPPEFLILGYRPSNWRPEDSLLVVLGMEETLGWSGEFERTVSVMEAALPASVSEFLTPRTDRYTHALLKGAASPFRPPRIPADALASLLNEVRTGNRQTVLVGDAALPKGSNGWVVGAGKTRDGRAILANDMHLALRVPNLWYRAELHYGDVGLAGVTLPGVPLLIAGSNEHIAWGFTNIEGDFSDLVALELDPADSSRYLSSKGSLPFGKRSETLHVRGEPDRTVEIRDSLWGPVMPEPLLGHPVAIRWTALDPEATDLKLLDLDTARDVHAALDLFNQAGGPPLNALVADRAGNIGWTYSGRIPKRFGFDGAVSRSWADGSRGWQGYIPPEQLPRLVNPPSGFIVNANQRMVDEAYPHVIGHYFDSGYRAYRIAERLQGSRNLAERDLLNIQLDTRAEIFRFYQQLALTLLSGGSADSALKQSLESWDGFAERESAGLAILVEFRTLLLDRVIGPFLARCRSLDPAFRFDWPTVDEPLQQILEAKRLDLLPEKAKFQDWERFLSSVLIEAERNVLARQRVVTPNDTVWGAANRAAIAHPFSASLPWLHGFLDMPAEPLPGCSQCVRWQAPEGGASERLIVAPGHEQEGILHMPGGQSGHPLSPHYRDQHRAWVEGSALPLRAGPEVHGQSFVPAATLPSGTQAQGEIP